MAGPRKLSVRQAKFIEEYAKDGNGARAVEAAGYRCKYPATRAWELLNNNAQVKAAVEASKQALIEKGAYNLERAVEETYGDLQEAKAAKQFSAVARLREQLHKLHGFLIDRLAVSVDDGLDIPAAMAEARRRVAIYVKNDEIEDAQVIEDIDIFS